MKIKVLFRVIFTLFFSCILFQCTIDSSLFTYENYINGEQRKCKPQANVYLPGFEINRFESQVIDYEINEKSNFANLQNKILFYGSSTMAFWNPTLVKNFDSLPVIGHGFGGSTFPEMIYYAPRLVYKYKPKVLVIYCENDIFYTPEKSVTQVNDDICEFLTRVNQELPKTKIVYLAMKHSPSRDFAWDKMNDINLYVKNLVNTNTNLTYVDLNPEIVNNKSMPDSSNFNPDYLHLNRNAYAKWSAKLKPILSELYNK